MAAARALDRELALSQPLVAAMSGARHSEVEYDVRTLQPRHTRHDLATWFDVFETPVWTLRHTIAPPRDALTAPRSSEQPEKQPPLLR